MKRLNILELHRSFNEKSERKVQTFEAVLEKCHRRICMANDSLKLKCVFVVQEYIVGFPIYDMNACIEYLMKSLEANGFLVKYFFPNYLYISWDFDEIKKDHTIAAPSQVDRLLLPPGVAAKWSDTTDNNISKPGGGNIKHLSLTSSLLPPTRRRATVNVKPSGKLELNMV